MLSVQLVPSAQLRGARLFTVGMTLNDLIKYAYDVQDKQIIKVQPWIGCGA